MHFGAVPSSKHYSKVASYAAPLKQSILVDTRAHSTIQKRKLLFSKVLTSAVVCCCCHLEECIVFVYAFVHKQGDSDGRLINGESMWVLSIKTHHKTHDQQGCIYQNASTAQIYHLRMQMTDLISELILKLYLQYKWGGGNIWDI